MESENNFVKRRGCVRASVLGANDSNLSTTGLIIGVAAASGEVDPIILATSAGVVTGAFIENMYLGYDCHGNVSVDWFYLE